MSTSWFGLVELLLFFGVILGWALWQWWDWQRWRKAQDKARHDQEDASP